MPEAEPRYRYVSDYSRHSSVRSVTKGGGGTAACTYYKVLCPVDEGISELNKLGDINSQSFTLSEIQNAFSNPHLNVEQVRNGLRTPLGNTRYDAYVVQCRMSEKEIVDGIKREKRVLRYEAPVDERGQIIFIREEAFHEEES